MSDYHLPRFPATGTFHDQLLDLVRYSAAPPSATEVTSGRFRVNARSIDVFLNPTWRPTAKGQDDRFRMMDVGRALFNLESAMRGFLLDPQVELMPDPTDPSWVARVWVIGSAIPSGQDAETISERPWLISAPTSVRALPVDPELVRALSREASATGAMLSPVDYGPPRDFLAATLREGEVRAARDRSRNAWRSRDDLVESLLGWGRALGSRSTVPHPVANAPVVVALGTHDDDVRSRVQAGVALQRIRALAHTFGLALESHDLALTYGDLRKDIAEEIGLRMHVQSVLHIGLPRKR